MEDLLQIEIFEKRVTYVIKRHKKVEKEILEEFEQYLKRSLNIAEKEILIQIVCCISNEEDVIRPLFPVNVTLLNYSTGENQNFMAASLEELYNSVQAYSTNQNFTMKFEEDLNIDEFNALIFPKSVLNKIAFFTQQYLKENPLELSNNLSVLVDTPMGEEYLFYEGKSRCITAPIMQVKECSNVRENKIEKEKSLVVSEINNFFSCINFNTGEYTLSLSVVAETKKAETIVYLRRGIERFWSNILEENCRGEKCLLLKNSKRKIV